MTERHKDFCLFLLRSVPTQYNIHILTSKLSTTKHILSAFIAKKEYFCKSENKKIVFTAATSITTKEILPTSARARISTKHANKIDQDIPQNYKRTHLMKAK